MTDDAVTRSLIAPGSARCSLARPPRRRATFNAPTLDWHALAPEVILTATIVVVLLVDLFTPDHDKWLTSRRRRPRPARRARADPHAGRRRRRPRSMFGGAYVVDDFALVMKAVFLVAGYITVLLSTQLHQRGRLLGGRVLPAARLVGAGHDGHGLGPRPHHDLRRPRAALDPRLPAGRLAQARAHRQRGRAEVLPDGRVRLGGDALRHVADLRRHRHARCWPTIGDADATAASASTPVAALGIVFVLVGLRLQGVGGAVPQLGARHLRGRAHAGHRVPLGGLEGGRLRGDHGADLRRPSTAATTCTGR